MVLLALTCAGAGNACASHSTAPSAQGTPDAGPATDDASAEDAVGPDAATYEAAAEAGTAALGVILDDGGVDFVYGEPDLLQLGGQRILVYLKDQPQTSLPGSPPFARPFVQVLTPGSPLAEPAVPIDFSSVMLENATTVFDADGAPVTSPPLPNAEFRRHIDAGSWYPAALAGGNVGLLLSAAEPRISEDAANGYCDPTVLETGVASTACETSPTWTVVDRVTGPGWGLFQNLWFVEIKLTLGAGVVTQATAVKATRLTYMTTFPQTSVTPHLFQGSYAPHFDPTGALAAWTQVRAFGTGGDLGNLGTYVVMAATFDPTGATPALGHPVTTPPASGGSAAGYACAATGLNNYQEVHGFVGSQSLIVAGNMNGQNENDQDLGLAPLTVSAGALQGLGSPEVVGATDYNQGNWSEGSASIGQGKYAGRIIATSNKGPDGASLYTGGRVFPCAGTEASGTTSVDVDYQIVGGNGPLVQVTSFNGLGQGSALVSNATLATTGVNGAAGGAVTEVVVDPSGAFVVGGLLLKNAASSVLVGQLWYYPLP